MDEEFPRRTDWFLFGSVSSSRNANLRSSVCLSDEKCSRDHNIFIFLSQVSLRLVSGRYLVLFRLGFH